MQAPLPVAAQETTLKPVGKLSVTVAAAGSTPLFVTVDCVGHVLASHHAG